MHKTLPEKYYLEHARELFKHIGEECDHLLTDKHRKFLHGFTQLTEDTQCLLVRCWARKPDFIKLASLNYVEIACIESALNEAHSTGYLRFAGASDWASFIQTLTKPQLIDCLARESFRVKTSSSKAEILTLARANLTGDEPSLSNAYATVVVRTHRHIFDYILFLFFGDLRNRFQQFAMRDLGVLKTRSGARTMARFETRAEAKSTFDIHLMRRTLLHGKTFENSHQITEEIAVFLLQEKAIGHNAQEAKDRLLLDLGEQLLPQNPNKAIQMWRASNDPKSIEKWVREVHKQDNREELKLELEQLREQELDAYSKVFVEDFYARKYLGKRTSVFTDMLRESTRVINIDEAYINEVEYGVIEHYQRQGAIAYFTENEFWRALFAVVFWDILYGVEQTQFSEFDRLPASLKNNRFYRDQRTNIEHCLTQLGDTKHALDLVSRRMLTHYGKPNGLFRWSENLLEILRAALSYGSAQALSNVLRRMAINYKHSRVGYPDLMIIDNGELRFEEIKAPGDALRANQLVSINRLRNAGLRVDLSVVEWATNPKQVYAVVDIETTGSKKGGNAITEIAVVHVQNGEIINEWSTLINPQRHIPSFITQLTGIDNAMVANAPVFSEIADTLELQLRDSIFVAHNVGFDYGFIKAAYEALGRRFHKPKLCTVSRSRKVFPGLKSYSLGALSKHFDINLVQHHRALADAQATAHLLRLIQDNSLGN